MFSRMRVAFAALAMRRALRRHAILFRRFEPVPVRKRGISEKARKAVEKVDRLAELAERYSDLDRRIAEHNAKTARLKLELDRCMAEHPLASVIDNIENHSSDDLRRIAALADRLLEYDLPARLSGCERYIRYARDAREIARDEGAIRKQSALLAEANEILGRKCDRYLDKDAGDAILSSLRDIFAEFAQAGRRYYDFPPFGADSIKRLNDEYVAAHISDPLFDDVGGICLNAEQRKAILCGSKSCLVVAGAGAGKTAAACGKAKWLLEREGVKPDEILMLSYSNESSADLGERAKRVCPGVKARTFHSLGLAILNAASGSKLDVDDQFMARIDRYFSTEIANDSGVAAKIFEYVALYQYSLDFDERKFDDDGERYRAIKAQNFVTVKQRLTDVGAFRRRSETIKFEKVKSMQELTIANWLFANSVAYEYEKPYRYDVRTADHRQYRPDFYLSDYDIWLEHFGIDRFDRAPQYSPEEERRYLDGLRWKRALHASRGTICVETYSYEFAEGTIFENLEKRLRAHGVKLSPIPESEMQAALRKILNGREMLSFMNLVGSFLRLYKSRYEDNSHFEALKSSEFRNRRARNRATLFLDICRGAYDYYFAHLRSSGMIDFDDMILKSAKLLENLDGFRYKHIIVDEFQDISQSRNQLLLRLMRHGDSRLFAVGDDWQAIYRFAGCDLSIFLNFRKIFRDPEINFITLTHRNSSELQSVANAFIMRNPAQFKKTVRSSSHYADPVRIIYHKGDKPAAFRRAVAAISASDPHAKTLVLCRNNADIDRILSDDIHKTLDRIVVDGYPDISLEYKTIHRSKGLECDRVILISGEDSRAGFPNKIEDDPLLALVAAPVGNFEFAEERRLFYVALTRTKNDIYILSDISRPSSFVKEIEPKAKVECVGGATLARNADIRFCPRCKSGRLVRRVDRRNRAYFRCSNHPYCAYFTYNVKAVEANMHCPLCGDYLVWRRGRYGGFLGCADYPRCRYVAPRRN